MRGAALILCILIQFFCIGCKRQIVADEYDLRISADISLSEVGCELKKAFSMRTGIHVDMNFYNASTITEQLRASRQMDVFLCANEESDSVLRKRGYGTLNNPTVFAQNSLVVISSKELDFGNLRGMEILCKGDYKYIAIAAPEFVSVGKVSKSWLESVPCPENGNFWNLVHPNVVRTPDSGSIINYVQHSSNALGVVYKSDYIATRDTLNVAYYVPIEDTQPILYFAAVSEDSSQAIHASAFINYLKTEEARSILIQHGLVPQ